MGQPFIGEIRMFGGSFAPAGWMFCDGQSMPISENDALFTLIGTTYGGDGQETFNLPDLQGRLPIHAGTGSGLQTYQLGEKGGVESVTLTTQQIPIHNHNVVASATPADANIPTNNTILASMGPAGIAQVPTYVPFAAGVNQITLNNATLTPTGGSQPHDNFQPTLCLSFIISLFGVFPQQN
jgi:microcystin-dependent protein